MAKCIVYVSNRRVKLSIAEKTLITLIMPILIFKLNAFANCITASRILLENTLISGQHVLFFIKLMINDLCEKKS